MITEKSVDKFGSDDLFNVTSANATSANVTALDFSVLFKSDLLQVGQPAMTRQVMSVTDTVAILGAFVANRALPAHGTPPT